MRRAELIFLIATTIVLTALALLSGGAYHDDDLTHYLFARDAWSEPRLFLDAWGRPGFTIPYALVAWIGAPETGFMACRLLSVAVTVATAALVIATARHLGLRRPLLAAVALLAMPLFLRLGYTTLTETIAALYLALGTWLVARGRFNRAAAAFALLPLARHEAVVLLALIGVLLLIERRVVAALLLGWAIVAWNLAGYALFGGWPAAVYFADRHAEVATYGAGSATFYLLRWLQACGLAGVVLTTVGATVMWRRRELLRTLVPLGAIGFVAVHTGLYMVNTHASGGYARFLVPVAPWMALCAAAGFEAATEGERVRGVALPALLALGLCAVAFAVDAGRVHDLAAKVYTASDLARLDQAFTAAMWAFVALTALAAVVAWRDHRRAGGALLALMLLAQVAHLAATVRPHRLGAQAEALQTAVREVRRRLGSDVPVYGWSVWTSWFDRLYSRHDRYVGMRSDPPPDWTLASPDAALVWDDKAEVPLPRRAGDTIFAEYPPHVVVLLRGPAKDRSMSPQ